jgi:hypothetical protein
MTRLLAFCFAAALVTGCAGSGEGGTGGTSGEGGSPGTGGTATGGNSATGGVTGTGGATGGTPGTGGVRATGGVPGTGGAKGGASGAGGVKATGGSPGTGGSTPDGGAVDCTAMLPSGGTMHTGSTQGMAGSLSWSLWMNGSGGSITTFTTPAFSASWGPNSGDFLARVGLQWGNGKAVSALGTVTADYVETKTGSGGGYSYIGIYGWSVNPCVEWYIVDDSFNNLPFNPGGTMVGTAMIDGGTYNIIQRSTTGTGGNRCGNVTSWTQFYSVRTSKRSCGTISISDHWAAWAAKNLNLGSVLEASILVEAGGGTGSIQFPVANVTAQ